MICIFLIVAKYTQHHSDHFKVYSSVVLSSYTLCSQYVELFFILKNWNSVLKQLFALFAFFFKSIFHFLAVLSLHCVMQAFLVVYPGSKVLGLSSWGSGLVAPRHVGFSSWTVIGPTSPALEGSGPLGKSHSPCFKKKKKKKMSMCSCQ